MNNLNIKSNIWGLDRFLIIAFLSPLISGISDFLLLYHTNLFQKTINYEFLFEISFDKRISGVLLGAVFIPFLWITYKKAISFLDIVSLNKIKKYAKQRSDRLQYLANSVKHLSDIMLSIQKTKVKHGSQ